jgi:hypothetical protein
MGGLHFTIRGTNQRCVFIELIGILCFATNCSVMNECDAPESNKIIADTELIGNIPNKTLGAS